MRVNIMMTVDHYINRFRGNRLATGFRMLCGPPDRKQYFKEKYRARSTREMISIFLCKNIQVTTYFNRGNYDDHN